jgi:hypothetical protein
MPSDKFKFVMGSKQERVETVINEIKKDFQ